MEDRDIDRILIAQLAEEASADLEHVALSLEWLLAEWAQVGVDPAALAWMQSLVERTAWWSGRLHSEADPALLALFPRWRE